MFKRLMAVLFGVALIGLGASIFILNNWGSDPITVFAQGAHNVLSKYSLEWFTVGRALITTNFIVFAVLLVIYKMRFVNIGTFAGMFMVGWFIDLFLKILSGSISGEAGLISKIIFMILSVVILSVGVGLYVSAELGAAPVDLISITISEAINKKYSIVRIICDTIFVLVGFLLGGVVGVSTIASMIFIGPISGAVIKIVKPYLMKD
jgi:uncharacterized membrane protein YczE